MQISLFWLAIGAPLAVLGQPAKCSGGPSERLGDEPSLVIGEAHFERRKLANGLRAVAVKDDGTDLSVFIAVAAGNRSETEATTGLAHLTEHAMFTGTAETGTDEHERIVVSWGGESNAFTRDDYTLYYDHGFELEHLADVLRMEADRLQMLSFDEAAVLHERERLRLEEEHAYRTADGRAEQLEHAFFQRHPYRHGLRDAQGHTKGPELAPELVRSFYREHYRPDRFAVVVVGPLEPSLALDAIQEAFDGLKNPPALGRPERLMREPPMTEPRSTRLPSILPRDRSVQCWLTPEMGHPDRAPLAVLASLLGRAQLPSGAVLTVGLGQRIDADVFQVGWSGPSKVADEVEALLASYRTGSVFQNKGSAFERDTSSDEIGEVKQLMLDSFMGQPLRARPYFSLAATFAWHEVYGQAESFAAWGAAVSAVSPADVQRVAAKWLDPKGAHRIVFEGTGAEIAALPDDVAGLNEAASQAAETGDYPRAIEIYTRLLAKHPSTMNTVIQLATRGQFYLELNDFDNAIADFERALKVIDYPAVRDLLEEAHARKARAMRGEFGGREGEDK